MALKKFIGARYAPEFAGEWSNTKQYAALSVVYTDNRSYVSRKTVPAGTAISNTEFWIQSSDWNAQVAEYNLKVEGYNANVEQYNKNVEDYAAAVSGFYADTLHSFDTKAEMQADKTLALGETLLTCGDKKIGDGGGSFYQVVAQTSVTAVALDNGLYAEPFEFQPYDYSQFQKEVEGYKDSTTRVYNVQADMVADEGINAGNVLMTTGAVEMGDGQGSFWNVSDEQSEGAVALNNGKYAKKFNLTSVDVSGNLLFNGKGNQVAIWGIKAGGEAVNVPVSYALGETRTVYVAVEYTPDNTNATVNLVVSGPTSFTKSFAWSDASVTSGQVKTVMYAITLHSQGNNVYTGAQTVTSYLTTLEKFTRIITVNVPNSTKAKSEWNTGSYSTLAAEFTVNTKVKLNSFTSYGKTSSSGYIIGTVSRKDNGTAYAATQNSTSTSSARLDTHESNAVLTPGHTYVLNFGSSGVANTFAGPESTTGSYGAFTFNNSAYAGTIEYTPIAGTETTVNIPDSSNPVWSNTGSNFINIPFTVNEDVCLHSVSINANTTAAFGNGTVYISTTNNNISGQIVSCGMSRSNNKYNTTAELNIALEAGKTYYLIFTTFSGTISTANNTTGTYGPFTFTDSPYSGTFTYATIN